MEPRNLKGIIGLYPCRYRIRIQCQGLAKSTVFLVGETVGMDGWKFFGGKRIHESYSAMNSEKLIVLIQIAPERKKC